MNELYDLNRDKSRYKNLKNDLSRIYDILSSTDLKSNLTKSASVLKVNYTIDNNSKYSKPINAIKNSLDDSQISINNIIKDISFQLNVINKDISELNNG